MQIITAQTIQEMFNAYNQATGYDVPFNVVWERQLWEAAKIGLTADLLLLAVKERLRGVGAGDRKPACVMPRNLIATDDAVNELLCEAYALMAKRRIKVMDAGRAEVMRMTGRPTELPTAKVRSSAEALASGWEQVRKVIGA